MTDELSDFFALPPFKADEALVQLRRDLRALKPLVEQGSGAHVIFTWRGLPVVELSAAEPNEAGQPVIRLRQARRPSQRPEWVPHTLCASAEVRKWLEQFKLSLRRWDDED